MAEDPVRRDTHRASDADRETVAGDLRDAFSEGRLDYEEYESRLDKLWQAKTYGELDRLTADLPQPLERRKAAAEQERRRKEVQDYLGEWKSWLGVAVVLIALWGITSLSSGELNDFWPVWPLGIWAAILLA
ncbi:MAG: DUF1707 SHOCT-like domain-containing protein, partial [Actinomycetota bacterium]